MAFGVYGLTGAQTTDTVLEFVAVKMTQIGVVCLHEEGFAEELDLSGAGSVRI